MESGTKTNLVEVIDPECISRRANRSSRLTFLTFLIKVSAMVAIQNMHWRTRQILPSLPPPPQAIIIPIQWIQSHWLITNQKSIFDQDFNYQVIMSCLRCILYYHSDVAHYHYQILLYYPYTLVY